jgi:glycosyltransferase involved in cell wall biosynthesis
VALWSLWSTLAPVAVAADPPLVSIVIPTLCAGPHADRLPTLRRLVARDLPAQTHGNYEALVVCDGHNPTVRDMIATLSDPRVSYHATQTRTGLWGHPATRLGIDYARGEYFVRMNDDNRPYCDYLASLLTGFAHGIDVTYARVVFANEARRYWEPYFRHAWSYVLPSDRMAHLHSDNIDCMNVMVRMQAAKAHSNGWDDVIDADWHFLDSVLGQTRRAGFVNRLIGQKN